MSIKNYKKRPTFNDLAKKTNLSIATISAYFNNKKIVKPETQEKISRAIEELSYIQDDLAASLKKRSTNSLGVIIPDISNPYYSSVLKGVEYEAQKYDLDIFISSSNYDPEVEKKRIDSFLRKRVDGLIVVSGINNDGYLIKLHNEGMPVILVLRKIIKEKIPSILIDNRKAAFNSIKYLYEKGHRNILYITCNFNNLNTIKDRHDGYLEAINFFKLKKYEIISDNILTRELEINEKLFEEILSYKEKIESIFTYTDLLAIGLIKKLKKHEIKIPEDISIIGFDNIILSDFIDPPLTTTKQPKKLMGALAVVLFNKIKNGESFDNCNFIDTEILERGSVKLI
jgi:LacI family transcriptional regulator